MVVIISLFIIKMKHLIKGMMISIIFLKIEGCNFVERQFLTIEKDCLTVLYKYVMSTNIYFRAIIIN